VAAMRWDSSPYVLVRFDCRSACLSTKPNLAV
jgi:hypothetical protein